MSNDGSRLHEVIERCKRAGFTGVVFVRSDEGLGQISFVAGVLDESRIGPVTGDEALAKLRALKGVTLDVHVRLPESKGLPVAFEGGLSEHGPIEIFRYCEDNALTCVVELRSGGIKGMANYVLGELTDVSCGGDTRDIAVTNMIAWRDGTYRIVLPGVDLPAGVTYQAPKRGDDEAPRKEAEASKADEARKAEEARLAEAQRKAEEERKLADARKAAEARRAEDARRADETKRKAEEARRVAEAERQAEEAARADAEKKKAEAAEKAAEEAARAEAAKQLATAEAAASAEEARKAKAEKDANVEEAEKAAREVKTAPSEAKPAAAEPKSKALSAPPAPPKKSALPMILFVILAIAAALAAYMKFMRK